MQSGAFSHNPSQYSADPSVIASLSAEQKVRLSDILDRYLADLEHGLPQDPEALLQAHPDLARPLQVYLESLARLHEVAAAFDAPKPPEPSLLEDMEERRLGDYVLQRVIGRGGMGIVYEARQVSLGKRVAVKVLPFAAVLDSKQIARFRNEAQAAAQLQHPNIVPVFAVGEERGVHYYAMQLIEGQPLDRAISEIRSRSELPIIDSGVSTAVGSTTGDKGDVGGTLMAFSGSYLMARRGRRRDYFRAVVELGIQGAEALQAAHAYGIIHRDIKPSNLLLDGEGKLWITDFGLARCETDMALTKTGDIVGTRRYMSPEQAAGDAVLIDQRTDIYSLAVTIYELLTLRPAYQEDSGSRRRGDPYEAIRPRQIDTSLPVDLETVILKGMARSRDDRYLTAQEFADDLRRVHEGKPIVARPPTLTDRLGKWTRRHARLVTATAALSLCAVLGLTAGTLLISREKHRAEQNLLRAEQNFHKAQEAVDRFGDRVAEKLSGIAGAEAVRRELLQETLQYHQDFVRQADQDPSLRSDLALNYSKIGTLAQQVGTAEEAIAAHEDALRILERLVVDQPRELEYRRELAICRNNLASALGRAGRTDDAARVYREAIELQNRLVADFAGDGRYQDDLALTHNNLGLLLGETGSMAEAEQEHREAIRLQKDRVSAAPADAEALSALATSYTNLAALRLTKDPEAAAKMDLEASVYQTQAVRARPRDLKYESDLASILNNMGAAEAHAGAHQKAAEAYGRAIEIQQRLVAAAPTQKSYRRDLALSHNNLGLTQSTLHQLAQAEESFRQSLAIQESLVAQNPSDIDLASSLGGIYNNLGFVQEDLRQFDGAAESYRLAVENQERAFARAPSVDRYRSYLSKHYYNYGRVLRITGHADEASRVALRREKLWPSDPQRLFSVAEELALASQAIAKQKESKVSVDECAAQAIDALRQAVAAGFKLPADLAENEVFVGLKKYPQFVELARP